MFRLQYFKEKEENMTRKNYFLGKRSEYRHNYLPFDFYDFWITAKENQNQRYKNKIRDYLHTPFDWDEDQDFYVQSNSSFGVVSNGYDSLAHQSTQTTYRSRATSDDSNDKNERIKKQNHNHPRPKSSISLQDEKILKKKQQRKPSKNENIDFDQEVIKQSKNENKTRQIKSAQEQRVKIKSQPEEHVQTKIEPKQKSNNQAKKRSRKNKQKSFKNELQTNYLNNAANSRNISNFDKALARSISSMTIQTPQAWNLRDYKPKPSKAPKLTRSSSIANLQPKRPPFALYGSATRSRDLSVKPTHNALANKNLAELHHDKDAIIELTLHKLKKEAALIANEYSLVESNVAEHIQNGGRSDSRAWNSEYDDKYPDYSASIYKKDIYLTQNPNRLSKSTLVNQNPQIRRGPHSAKAKIYY